ncbi:lachesin-like [Bacillus rossius redtenbacheri]|uniref:lachesin-like n=1 Tax=Bacillus rossius redtenbacheri TaxID=93214 RepID=UPI002FDD8274
MKNFTEEMKSERKERKNHHEEKKNPPRSNKHAAETAAGIKNFTDSLGPPVSPPTTARSPAEEPDFRLPIGNVTTPLGKEAVLSCTVDQLGKYKVGWLKAEDQTILTLHNKVVTHNSRVSVSRDGDHTWRLHVRQVKEADRGCYMCQINTNVMKKQVGCLDVHVPPDILYDETSADVAVQEGDNATLSCRAKGRPSPRLTWRRESGQDLVLRRGPREFAEVESYNGSLLHFWRVDRRQMGAYLCIASNDVPPAVSKRIILNVNFPPVIKVPNQLLGAPLGTDVQLECHVEAFPNTINYWIKNRGEMLLDGLKYAIRENRSSYKMYMWLVIRAFGKADIGTYNCVSTNSLGRAEGTLRLYEIKVYSGINHESAENRVSIVGGLAEAARGDHAKGAASISDRQNRTWGRCPSSATVLLSCVFLAVVCSGAR